MFVSARASQIILRVGTAIVFFWFGMNAFMQPHYWATMWIPQGLQTTVARTGMEPANLAILFGIFLVLVAASLATGFFMRGFAVAGTIFLIMITATRGIADAMISMVGVLGALVALVVWPERTYQ